MAVATIGCSQPLGLERDDEAPIQTRALEYTLSPRFGGLGLRITYTYRNTGAETAYIVHCREPRVSLEKQDAEGWKRVNVVTNFGCLSPPIAVEAGEEWTGRLFTSGGAPDCNCFPRFASGDPEGTYRLVIEGVVYGFDQRARPFGRPVPLEDRVSNRFKIRLP